MWWGDLRHYTTLNFCNVSSNVLLIQQEWHNNSNAAAVGHWCQYASMAVNERLRTSIVLIPNQTIELTRQYWNKGTWIANCFRIIPQQVKCSTLTIRLLTATSVSFHLAWHSQTVSICCQISLVLDLLPRARPQSWRRSLALATGIYDKRYKTQLNTRTRKNTNPASVNGKIIFKWHLPISSTRAVGFDINVAYRRPLRRSYGDFCSLRYLLHSRRGREGIKGATLNASMAKGLTIIKGRGTWLTRGTPR